MKRINKFKRYYQHEETGRITDIWYAAYYAFMAGYEASEGKEHATEERGLSKHAVNSSALSRLEIIIVLPLIEKRYKEVDEYTIEHHELGHLIERLKSNLS